MKYFVQLLPLLISFQLHSQNEWKLNKEENGIKIYARHSDISNFNDIKVEMDVVGSVETFREIIADAETYTEWSYATPVSTVIESITPNEFIYYSVTEVPWPASDRDFYARVVIDVDSIKNTLRVLSTVLPNYSDPVKGKVRITRSIANWTITPFSEDKIHIQYTLQLDPGGSVPAWLLNMFSTTAPLASFENLKRLVEKAGR